MSCLLALWRNLLLVNHAAMAAYRHAAKGGVMGGGARIDRAARKGQLKDDEALAESSGLPVFVMEAGKLSVLETVGMAKLIVLRIGNTDCQRRLTLKPRTAPPRQGRTMSTTPALSNLPRARRSRTFSSRSFTTRSSTMI